MSKELAKTYDPKQIEEKLYESEYYRKAAYGTCT